VTSLHRDFIPSSWGYFHPTAVDIAIYLGSLGLFFTCFLLFLRWIPMIAVAELKATLPEAHAHLDDDHAHGDDHAHTPATAEGAAE
jgi:molybdopterin-containing oxidoreductase family membrane subunit